MESQELFAWAGLEPKSSQVAGIIGVNNRYPAGYQFFKISNIRISTF
jgi:hypothetical protein